MNPTAPTPDQQPVGQVPEVPQTPTPEQPVPAPAAVRPAAPQQAIPATPTPTPAAVPAPPPASDDPQAATSPTLQPVRPVGEDAPMAAPAVAEDVDVIEKEWVDKAEADVRRTEGDPHAEEEAIEDLNVDYLKKRYDYDVDKPAA